MADYRLYILDAEGHIHRAVEIVAEDDAEASGLARDGLNGEPAELWNLGRKVETFRPEPPRARKPSGRSGLRTSAT